MNSKYIFLAMMSMIMFLSYPLNANAQRTQTFFEKKNSVITIWCNPELIENKQNWPLYQDVCKVLVKNGWKKTATEPKGKKYIATIDADLMITPASYEGGDFKPRHKGYAALSIWLNKPSGQISVYMPFDYDDLEHIDFKQLMYLINL